MTKNIKSPNNEDKATKKASYDIFGSIMQEINNENCYNNNSNVVFEKRIANFCELPLTLNVADVAKVLGISKQNAYSLCHSKGFPCIQIGKRLVIPKPAFEKWMENPFIFESEENKHG